MPSPSSGTQPSPGTLAPRGLGAGAGQSRPQSTRLLSTAPGVGRAAAGGTPSAMAPEDSCGPARRPCPCRAEPASPPVTPTQTMHWALSQAAPAPGSFFPNQRRSLISYRTAIPGLMPLHRGQRPSPRGRLVLCPPDPPGRGWAGAVPSASEDLTQHKPLLHSLRKENAFLHWLHY